MSTPRGTDERGTLWQRFVGDVDRVGWWTLPAFLAVGLAGAVMAGALAVVYYSQQVADLESETRQARQDLQAGVADVEEARDDALEAIEAQVDAVEDALASALPVEDPATLGLVVVEARVNSPPPPSATVAPDPPAPAGGDAPDGAPAVTAQQRQPRRDRDQQPSDQPSPTRSPEPSPPAPSPSPRPVEPRVGVGFVVAFERGHVFVATSHGLVADARARAGVVEEVVVTLPDGSPATGVVHSWDQSRDLALLRVPAGELPVADWRPRGDVVERGDVLTIVGLTPQREIVAIRTTVAVADVEKIVAPRVGVDFLRGAPVLDRTGRVVAVNTLDYRPYGAAAGDGQALAPVGLFCERMLSGCDSLEVEATEPADDPT